MKSNKNGKQASLEEWLHFSWSYLELAEIGCDYWIIRLKDPKNFKKNYPEFCEPINVRSFLPIIFNVKHSLELFLKRISASLSAEIDHTHDLEELSKNMREVNWVNVRKNISSLPDKNTNGEIIKTVKEICKEKNRLEYKTKELIDIVDCYYHLKPVLDAIDTEFLFSDTDNTAFKYPENSLLVSFDYSNFTDKIKVDDFSKIKKDISKLKECYSDIGLVLRVYAENK